MCILGQRLVLRPATLLTAKSKFPIKILNYLHIINTLCFVPYSVYNNISTYDYVMQDRTAFNSGNVEAQQKRKKKRRLVSFQRFNIKDVLPVFSTNLPAISWKFYFHWTIDYFFIQRKTNISQNNSQKLSLLVEKCLSQLTLCDWKTQYSKQIVVKKLKRKIFTIDLQI